MTSVLAAVVNCTAAPFRPLKVQQPPNLLLQNQTTARLKNLDAGQMRNASPSRNCVISILTATITLMKNLAVSIFKLFH